jgi:hypothetical protein
LCLKMNERRGFPSLYPQDGGFPVTKLEGFNL